MGNAPTSSLLNAGETLGTPVTASPDASLLKPGETLGQPVQGGGGTTPNYAPGRAFGMEVAKGMGLDAESIKQMEDSGGTEEGLKELGRQVYEGLHGFVKNVAQDPTHLMDPVNAMASGVTGALGLPDKSIKEGFHKPSVGQLVGALSTILGSAEAPNAAGAAREGIGGAIHTPEGGLTSGAKAVGKVGGGLAGGAIGSSVGHEYLGAAAGYKMGPEVLDRVFPEPKSAAEARVQAEIYQQKAEDLMKRGKEQEALDTKMAREQMAQKRQAALEAKTQASQKAKEFLVNTEAEGNKQDLITRTKKLVKPGEEPTSEDLKRAGDMTQVPLARLKTLASFGDKLAQNELNRRLRNQ